MNGYDSPMVLRQPRVSYLQYALGSAPLLPHKHCLTSMPDTQGNSLFTPAQGGTRRGRSRQASKIFLRNNYLNGVTAIILTRRKRSRLNPDGCRHCDVRGLCGARRGSRGWPARLATERCLGPGLAQGGELLSACRM